MSNSFGWPRLRGSTEARSVQVHLGEGSELFGKSSAGGLLKSWRCGATFNRRDAHPALKNAARKVLAPIWDRASETTTLAW